MAPKVSDEYLENRRLHVLGAAHRCFHRKGFHRTTMQDICAEAEMSPGAVYRYFESKEDIFAALAERRLEAQREAMGNMPELDSVFAALSEVMRFVCAPNCLEGAPVGADARPSPAGATEAAARVDVELWGEAMTNPRVREIVQSTMATVRSRLVVWVVSLQERGRLARDLDPVAVARVLMSLFQGARLQQALGLDIDLAQYVEVVGRLELGARRAASAPAEESVA